MPKLLVVTIRPFTLPSTIQRLILLVATAAGVILSEWLIKTVYSYESCVFERVVIILKPF